MARGRWRPGRISSSSTARKAKRATPPLAEPPTPPLAQRHRDRGGRHDLPSPQAAFLKHPRTPTSAPGIDYQSADSEHLMKRMRVGQPDEVWDAQSGQKKYTFEGHESSVYSVCPHYKENIQVAAAGAWREKLQLLDWLGDGHSLFVALATGARCCRSSSSWRRREIELQLAQLAGDRAPVGSWCWRSSSGQAGTWY